MEKLFLVSSTYCGFACRFC